VVVAAVFWGGEEESCLSRGDVRRDGGAITAGGIKVLRPLRQEQGFCCTVPLGMVCFGRRDIYFLEFCYLDILWDLKAV